MTKHTVTMPCEFCEGKGTCTNPDRLCPSCLGQGHLEHDVLPPHPDFLRSMAFLTREIPHLPYANRKRLETAIADALFKGEIEPACRPAWEQLVDTLRQTEGM